MPSRSLSALHTPVPTPINRGEQEPITLSGKSHDSDAGHTWQPHHEQLVARWALHAQYYKTMHSRAARYFRKKEMYMGIPTTLLTAVTSTATFATLQGDDTTNRWVRALIGVMLTLTTVISALHNFLNFGALAGKHSSAAIAYESIYRDAEEILSYSRSKRSNVRAFVRNMKNAMRALRNASPDIPEHIMDFYLSDLDQVLQPDELKVTQEEHDIPTPEPPSFNMSPAIHYSANPLVGNDVVHSAPLPHNPSFTHTYPPPPILSHYQNQTRHTHKRPSFNSVPPNDILIDINDELIERMDRGVRDRKRAIQAYQERQNSDRINAQTIDDSRESKKSRKSHSNQDKGKNFQNRDKDKDKNADDKPTDKGPPFNVYVTKK